MTAPDDRTLVVEIAAVLRERIAPLVAHDPWATSELRSIDALLALVAARLEHGAAVAAQDTVELAALLERLREGGIEVPPAEGREAMRAALGAALPSVHDGRHAGEAAAVRRYLVRMVEREQRVYGAFAGRRLF